MIRLRRLLNIVASSHFLKLQCIYVSITRRASMLAFNESVKLQQRDEDEALSFSPRSI